MELGQRIQIIIRSVTQNMAECSRQGLIVDFPKQITTSEEKHSQNK